MLPQDARRLGWIFVGVGVLGLLATAFVILLAAFEDVPEGDNIFGALFGAILPAALGLPLGIRYLGKGTTLATA